MALTPPKPDQTRFSPIAVETLTLAYLSRKPRGLSPSMLRQRLKRYASAADLGAAVATLEERGAIVVGDAVALSAQGRTQVESQLGTDAGADWETIKLRRLPLLTLGIDPDDDEDRRHFSNAEPLKAATVAVAFGLPKEAMLGPKALYSELVWRLLLAAMPELVGKGPFPKIEAPGVVERTLLGGLAGIKAKSLPEALGALATLAVGLKTITPDTLRVRLVEIGVQRATSAAPPKQEERAKSDANGVGAFASQVNGVARTLTTPPFQGRVAIAQVYDAYGRQHRDAGSLASFKERLLEAAQARKIELGRLDLPERMSKELRLRSETQWGSDQVHFVVTRGE